MIFGISNNYDLLLSLQSNSYYIWYGCLDNAYWMGTHVCKYNSFIVPHTPQISAGGCGNGLPVKTDAFTFVIWWRYLLVEKSNETCDKILFEFVVDKVTLWQSTSMCLIYLWNLELADWPNYIPRFSAEEMIDEWRKSTMVCILHKKVDI